MQKRSRIKTIIVRITALAVWTAFLIVATLLFAEAMRVKGMHALGSWHQSQPVSEFTAADAKPGFTFDQYLEKEKTVFAELDAFMLEPTKLEGNSGIIRYARGGKGDPATFTPNWNRTQVLEPKGEPVGGVLLLHGLTDSPYAMRSMAEFFLDQGYRCVCLRYPGHGTVPGALLKAKQEDWFAAVKLAWQSLKQRTPADKPLLVCGFSTGGALAVLLTLDAIERNERVPDRLFLFSPALGITPFAVASNLHRLYSWIPFYNKAQWLSIEPEYDPFKYNSFPQAAGAQSWALTGRVAAALEAAAANGKIARMPPVLSFTSLVDATVIAHDALTRLFDRLPANGSEIVVFDVNRGAMLDGFFTQAVPELGARLKGPALNFGMTLVTNLSPQSLAMVTHERPAGSTELKTVPIDEAWPPQVYSLAHVSIPIPPDDALYGDDRTEASAARVHLGDLKLRGERGVLSMSADDLMRLRHNPFHSYMIERMQRALPAQ